jgi:M6 family metalloprotease-like protein
MVRPTVQDPDFMRTRHLFILIAILTLAATPSCGPRKPAGGAGVPQGTSAVNFALGLQDLDAGNRLLGNLRAVVVLMEFPDAPVDKALYPPERLETFMFRRDAKGLGQYVAENSGGRYTIDGQVFGWYRSRYTLDEINRTPGGLRGALGRVAEDAVRRVLDERVNPAAFDNDGPDGVTRAEGSTDDDGLVDELYVVVPGQLPIGHGVMGRYADFARRTTFLHLTTGEGGFGPTGFYLHEAGHDMFAALDHYGNHYQGDYGIGIWGMMGLGCWGQRGDIPRDRIWTQPAHFTAYHKIVIGWLEPRVITETARDVRLDAMEVRPDCIEIPIPGTLEYFLVENRQPIGFEDELPGGGLLITHCTRTWKGTFTLVQADGRDDLQHGHAVGRPYPPTTEDLGDDGDPFPGSTGNRAFGPKTTPNSHTSRGLESGITVRGISPPGETMSFDVIIDADIQDGLARITTIRGSLDELKAPHAVRRRNAALSLLEIAEITGGADQRMVTGLIEALDDADRKVRLHAAQALGRLKATQAVARLAQIAAHGDPEQAAAAIEALGRIVPQLTGGERLEALAPMTAALESGSKDVRAAGLAALGGLGDLAFESAFIEALDDQAPLAQQLGAEGLGRMKSNKAVARLIVIARDDAHDQAVRVAAIEALGRIGYEPAAVGLHSLLHAPAFPVRRAAVHALRDIHSKDSIPALVAALSDETINEGNRRHADLRLDAKEALTAIGPDVVPALIAFLDDDKAPLDGKLMAAGALAKLGDVSATDPIVRLALSIVPRPGDDQTARDLQADVRDGLAGCARRLVQSVAPNGETREQRDARASLNVLVSVAATWLMDKDPKRRIEGAGLLQQCAAKPVPDELLAALDDRHPDVREAAADALAPLKDERALPGLVERLDDTYATVRAAAAAALGELGDGRAAAALADRMAVESDRDVTTSIARALAQIGTPETVQPLLRALNGPVYEARIEAARGLAKHKRPEVVDALIAALPDADHGVLISARRTNSYWPRLRVWAMRALASIGDPRAIEPIRAYLEADDLSCRLPAALALLRLSGKSTNGRTWPEIVCTLSEHIEATTGRELLEFIPREYLRE